MIFYNIITALCLSLMAVSVLLFFYFYFKKNRADRITYIRNFKKGKGVLVYIYLIPLYWIGYHYSGQTVFSSFFSALGNSLELVLLRYNVKNVQLLFDTNNFYATVMRIGFILVTLNAFIFVLSFIGQYFSLFFKSIYFSFTKREKLYILGDNYNSRKIYKSELKRKKCIIDKFDEKVSLELYKKNIFYKNVNDFDKIISKIINESLTDKNIKVVINTDSDEFNLNLCTLFNKKINELSIENQVKCFDCLRIFVFGDPKFEAVYCSVVSHSFGCISFIDKYKKIAFDFINKYPFAYYLNENQIDYNTSLIKKDVDLNAFLIGFGKTNQQVFLSSVANNQFITKEDNKVKIKPVNYFIFDKNHAENNKNLNHNYKRYKNEVDVSNKNSYVDLPEYPANDKYFDLDINNLDFYNNIRNSIDVKKESVNYIVIAFGSDLENIDFANKINIKFFEWGIKNFYIFVKTRDLHLDIDKISSNCFIFGYEDECVYNIEKIIDDKFFKMARMRDESYLIENKLKNELENCEKNNLPKNKIELSQRDLEKCKVEANLRWFLQKTQDERDSSLYGCLSLRSKLNLMGLDYCEKAETKRGLTEEEYFEVYAKEDKPIFENEAKAQQGKKIVYYSLDFANSRRTDMAILEHYRWNSYMITRGFIPATEKQILEEQTTKDTRIDNIVSYVLNYKNLIDKFEETKPSVKFTNGKNYSLRVHGNLTTFDGLIDFRKKVSLRDFYAKDNTATMERLELKNDVIKYDYQILDDAFWLLDRNGYKIIKK